MEDVGASRGNMKAGSDEINNEMKKSNIKSISYKEKNNADGKSNKLKKEERKD
jgi:hypothetical protein